MGWGIKFVGYKKFDGEFLPTYQVKNESGGSYLLGLTKDFSEEKLKQIIKDFEV